MRAADRAICEAVTNITVGGLQFESCAIKIGYIAAILLQMLTRNRIVHCLCSSLYIHQRYICNLRDCSIQHRPFRLPNRASISLSRHYIASSLDTGIVRVYSRNTHSSHDNLCYLNRVHDMMYTIMFGEICQAFVLVVEDPFLLYAGALQRNNKILLRKYTILSADPTPVRLLSLKSEEDTSFCIVYPHRVAQGYHKVSPIFFYWRQRDNIPNRL